MSVDVVVSRPVVASYRRLRDHVVLADGTRHALHTCWLPPRVVRSLALGQVAHVVRVVRMTRKTEGHVILSVRRTQEVWFTPKGGHARVLVDYLVDRVPGSDHDVCYWCGLDLTATGAERVGLQCPRCAGG